MARMVSDMLFLANAERGMVLPGRERFAMALEVQALMEFFDAGAEEKGVRLTLSGDGELDGDRLMFRRAMGNLLSNAVRHSDPGSPVEKTVHRGEYVLSIHVMNTADVRRWGPAPPVGISSTHFLSARWPPGAAGEQVPGKALRE